MTVLVSLIRNEQIAPQARVAAIKELWDRAHGKAAQAVNLDAGPNLQKLIVEWVDAGV